MHDWFHVTGSDIQGLDPEALRYRACCIRSCVSIMGLLQNVSSKDLEPKKPEFTERK